jgi:hypothetical protein
MGDVMSTSGKVKARKPKSWSNWLPAGKGQHRPSVYQNAAGIGRTEKKNGEHGIDQPEILDDMALFLAAACAFLFKRIAGRGIARSVPS